MGKTNKNIKHTRKVILLKYEDKKETLILSKTVKRTKEKLTIKVKCNTKIKKRLIDTESKVPFLPPQLKDRVVPCCCRAKCFKKEKIKKEKCIRRLKYEKTLKRREMSLSSISSISDDELNNNSIFENISSDDFSFSTDDEIESLMKSTRRRMKDLDDDWNLYKRTSSLVSKQTEKLNSSINSLDTLILEMDDTKHSEPFNLHNDVYSPIINTETKLKYDYLETNNNDTKLNHVFMDEQTLYNNNMNKDYFEKNKDAMVPKLEHDTDNIQNLKINNICV